MPVGVSRSHAHVICVQFLQICDCAYEVSCEDICWNLYGSIICYVILCSHGILVLFFALFCKFTKYMIFVLYC